MLHDFGLGRVAQSDDRHDRSDADDNAQHGQQRPHFVRQNRMNGHRKRFRKAVAQFRQTGTLDVFDGILQGEKFIGFARVGNDASVLDFDDAVGLGGDVRVVRDHDNRVSLTVQGFDDFHDGFAAFGIQRARRFVGKDNLAPVHQSARNADALLLPAGKLARLVFQPFAQVKLFQQRFGARGAVGFADARIDGGQGRVFNRVQIRQQVVTLKDEAERLAPQSRLFVFGHFGNLDTVDFIRSRRRHVQTADDVHQRRFARSRLSDNRDEIALFNGEINVFQNVGSVVARAEKLVDFRQFNDVHQKPLGRLNLSFFLVTSDSDICAMTTVS